MKLLGWRKTCFVIQPTPDMTDLFNSFSDSAKREQIDITNSHNLIPLNTDPETLAENLPEIIDDVLESSVRILILLSNNP
jgi:hypothetical protein